jgi:hypothetical protein
LGRIQQFSPRSKGLRVSPSGPLLPLAAKSIAPSSNQNERKQKRRRRRFRRARENDLTLPIQVLNFAYAASAEADTLPAGRARGVRAPGMGRVPVDQTGERCRNRSASHRAGTPSQTPGGYTPGHFPRKARAAAQKSPRVSRPEGLASFIAHWASREIREGPFGVYRNTKGIESSHREQPTARCGQQGGVLLARVHLLRKRRLRSPGQRQWQHHR